MQVKDIPSVEGRQIDFLVDSQDIEPIIRDLNLDPSWYASFFVERTADGQELWNVWGLENITPHLVTGADLILCCGVDLINTASGLLSDKDALAIFDTAHAYGKVDYFADEFRVVYCFISQMGPASHLFSEQRIDLAAGLSRIITP